MKDNIIVDTNVILSGLKSRNGYSFKLLELIPANKFRMHISVPLILEYEAILMKFKNDIGFSKEDISDFLDYICLQGKKTKIFYLWRPVLKDPFDDHILEVAVGSNSNKIITYNKKDFQNALDFGIEILTPQEYLTQRRFI